MRSHGNYNITVEGNIIKCYLSGSFNIECAEEFYTGLINEIKAIRNKPFFIYINVIEFIGATPEAYKKANDFNQWINENHPPKTRIYIINKDSKLSIALREEKDLAKQNIKIFKNDDDAKAWIKHS